MKDVNIKLVEELFISILPILKVHPIPSPDPYGLWFLIAAIYNNICVVEYLLGQLSESADFLDKALVSILDDRIYSKLPIV